jgi:hypothetical protein
MAHIVFKAFAGSNLVTRLIGRSETMTAAINPNKNPPSTINGVGSK